MLPKPVGTHGDQRLKAGSDSDRRRVVKAMRSEEWPRTQRILRVTFDVHGELVNGRTGA